MSWALFTDFVGTGASVLTAILPLLVLFLVFQIFLLKLPPRQVRDILLGTALAASGLFLFLLGISVGFLPLGRAIGEEVGHLRSPWSAAAIGLLLGFVTAWGEPAVRILADQVETASNGSIRGRFVLYAVALGVAAWVALGMLRIYFGMPLLYLLVPGYLLAVLMLRFSNRDFVAIAIDASGVATGPLANTFLLALALGASSVMEGQNPVIDGLGFVALIALAPIISVMALGLVVTGLARKE